jgi:hypothetical protein
MPIKTTKKRRERRYFLSLRLLRLLVLFIFSGGVKVKPSRNRSLAYKRLRWLIMTTLFAALSGSYLAASANHYSAVIVSCESKDYHKNLCRVDTRGGVHLFKQMSKSPCIKGRTWGFNRKGIWVDHGCRAKFEVGRCEWCPKDWSKGKTISCGSHDFRKNFCRVDTRGGVHLIKQESKAPCIRGRTWGFNRKGIWVDCGCRAKFKVRRCGWCWGSEF